MSFKTITVDIPLGNGEIDSVDIQIFACDKCGRSINASKEPIILDQSCVSIVHPSGFDEVVHVPNSKAGYTNHYCLDCALTDGIPYFSQQEKENVLKAMTRRFLVEGYGKRNPSLQPKLAEKIQATNDEALIEDFTKKEGKIK